MPITAAIELFLIYNHRRTRLTESRLTSCELCKSLACMQNGCRSSEMSQYATVNVHIKCHCIHRKLQLLLVQLKHYWSDVSTRRWKQFHLYTSQDCELVYWYYPDECSELSNGALPQDFVISNVHLPKCLCTVICEMLIPRAYDFRFSSENLIKCR